MLVAIDCEKNPDADFAVAAEIIGIAFSGQNKYSLLPCSPAVTISEVQTYRTYITFHTGIPILTPDVLGSQPIFIGPAKICGFVHVFPLLMVLTNPT